MIDHAKKELQKTYEPSGVEDRIYAMWQEGGYFGAEPNAKAADGSVKKPFTIVIPPPNVTGQLHMGHALDETWQDVLIRFKRMQGFETLWVPGTDHAGIATQIKLEEHLRETEGLTRYDLGRERFVERVWEWKRQYGSRIVRQLKKLGSSCDWTRERFTMDEGLSKAVREVFVRLYEKGLIYKGNRIINWCPKCRTALSDAEVEYAEHDGHLWHIRYPVKDSDEYVVVATTRPETMLGDTAVAVNPEDERYTHLIGKTVILPLMGREIPVIADDYVDMEFGTGCVKITPCHDPNDFEVGKRHGLEEILVLDEDAKVNENGGIYQGLERYDARKRIVDDLREQGYLVKIEEHKHNVGECYRCGDTVEPVTSSQWFVKMKPLAEPAIEIVKNGTIQFVPERFTKTYINWMEGTRDWCISRQLWWGHRIPAFYCNACGHMHVSREYVTICEKCGSSDIVQDEDVLDTWFSSALWPFSTLGWPDRTEDLDYFFPSDVLVTGYDIIGFWVSRMIFSSVEQMGREPFRTVLIHGLVRDAKGRKMSKSLGNGIDPLEIIEKYGADALRMTLLIGNSPGNDMRFSDEKIESMRNFANKLWNASRFVLMNLTIDSIGLPDKLNPEDKWILSRYNSLVADVTANMEKFEIGLASQKLYDFLWDTFCDWYIELTKPRLYAGGEGKIRAEKVLAYVLAGTLKLLHPFMPFITEEIWQALPGEKTALIVAEWPEYEEALSFAEVEGEVETVMEAIRAVRNRRAEMNVPPSRKAKVLLMTEHREIFEQMLENFKKLAYTSDVEFIPEAPADLQGYTTAATGSAQIYMPMAELVDTAKELERLERELGKAKKELEAAEKKLSNPGFLAKAPADVVAAERKRADSLRSVVEKLTGNIASLK